MEKPDYRFFLLLSLILASAIIISFLLAYAFIYVVTYYGTLALIIAFSGLVVVWVLYKKYKKRRT